MQGRAWCCLFWELTQISTMSSISSIDTALTDGAGELASISLILLLVDSAGKFKVSQVPAEVSGTILTHITRPGYGALPMEPTLLLASLVLIQFLPSHKKLKKIAFSAIHKNVPI
jgi:hypothetical protein